MPTYDFKCDTCGETREKFVRLVDGSAPRGIPCPCGGEALRQPCAPAFTLQWARPPMDNPREIFAGTRLADSDGINETQYESTKAFSI